MKMKRLHLPLGIRLVGICSQSLHATVWIGSQPGKSVWWGTAGNWTDGAPNSTTSATRTQAYFLLGSYGGAMTGAVDNVTITGGDRVAYYLRVGLGKTVNFTMNNALTLNPSAASIFGTSEFAGNIGTGASTTNFLRTAEGYVNIDIGQFFVGYDLVNGIGGHVLNFSGELNVSDTGTLASSVLGYRGNDNQLMIQAKAKLDLRGLSISTSTSYKGNLVTVTDADSLLNIRETLSIGGNAFTGGGTVQETYNGAARLNGVLVSDGAHATVKTLGIGRAENARSNYLRINGEGSQVSVSASTFIGIADNTSLGGNEVTVGGGGKLITSGGIFIAGFKANDGLNDGANRLTIEDEGTVVAESDIDVGGLLQLAEGGELQTETDGISVNIKAGGRFEVEGAGLGSLVSTSLENGGTLAIGVGESRTSATTLQLNSGIQSDGGTLELTAWSGTSIDQIEFLADGWLAGTITLTIQPEGFVISEGDSWTVFTGETGGISATFDFSQLGFAVDSSSFNETGGWRLTVIPEPSTYAMLGTGLFLLLAARARQTKRS